jgi:hypothetical protein
MNTRNIFILGFILLSVSTSFSQSSKSSLGFEGGPSFVSSYGNERLKESRVAAFSFSGGFSYQYRISDLLSLQTNLSFERKGLGAEDDVFDESGEVNGKVISRFHLNYLTVPVMCRVTFGEKIKFFANAGPYAGVLLSQRTIRENTREADSRKESNDIEIYDRMDYGVSSGVGINFQILQDLMLGFELRNNLGLVNISPLPVFGGTIRNNTTSLLIGIAFNL